MRKIGRREFLKQSSLASIMVAAPIPASQAWPPSAQPAGSALTDPVDSPAAALVPGRQLDSREFCLSVYERTTPSLTFSATDARSARRWQSRVRRKLVELLGGFPAERADLRPEILETKDLGAYTREKLVFQSRDNLSVIGYLLLPKDRPRPLPAVVCLPGHGRGVDDAVGIAEDGTQRTARSTGYAKDFAIQVVEHGYAALAIEQLAFGYRRDEAARRSGPEANSCRPAACAALLFGQTMLGWRVWDVMRAIDYLETRPEIDPARIATMGISGGGTVSLFSAALDERIRVAVVSCYFNTFRDSIVSLSHCPDNYVPGILNYIEMYDLAGLVAPRGLFVEAGTRDRIFPIEGSRIAIEKARHIYSVFGAPEKVGHEIFDGGHEFHGTGAFEFLARWL